MCAHPLVIVQFNSFERNEQFASINLDFQWKLSCGFLHLRLILSCGWPDFQELNTSCGWFYAAAISSSSGWIQVAIESSSVGWMQVTADSILWLPRVPAAGYGLRPTPSHGWLEFQRVDTRYSWLHPTADSSCSGWIRLKADSILRLTTSCGWFYSEADSSPPTGLDLWLTCTLTYQENLRTYSVK